jgi:hypothetical protein
MHSKQQITVVAALRCAEIPMDRYRDPQCAISLVEREDGRSFMSILSPPSALSFPESFGNISRRCRLIVKGLLLHIAVGDVNIDLEGM